MNKPYGPHITLDLSGCKRESLTSFQLVRDILDELPTLIGMHKIIPPYVIQYDEGKCPEDWGITGIVIIAESHISIHTYPEKGYVFIDIFSCKNFDEEKAVRYLRNIFQPQKSTINVVQRGLDFPRKEEELNIELPVVEEVPEYPKY